MSTFGPLLDLRVHFVNTARTHVLYRARDVLNPRPLSIGL
jgi:hypothetical protein